MQVLVLPFYTRVTIPLPDVLKQKPKGWLTSCGYDRLRMHSQNKPSSGTVGTIFCRGFVSKISFPIGSEYDLFIQFFGNLYF